MRASKCSFSKYLAVMLALLWSAAMVTGPVWAAAAPESQTAGTNSLSKARVAEDYGKLPLFFTQNQGQIDSQVHFFTQGQGYAIYFTPEKMVLGLSRPDTDKAKKGQEVVQLCPQGIRSGVEILGAEPLAGKVNYFRGLNPAKWRTDMPTYKSVVYREAYPGIDLKFYGAGQQVEYDVVVKPGADPKQVKFLYQGIEALKLTKAGELTVNLPDGGQLVQQKPVIYQEIDGQRISREGKFRLLPGTKNRGYGFELASYDARYPLVIDPVLNYSTYLGGSVFESGNGIAVDAAGSAYVVGSTQSLNFPTVAPAQALFGGETDAFVTKFNPAGSALVYSTYLGGGDNDYGFGIAVDTSGNAYVTGQTFSGNFPVMGAYQATLRGTADAFVTRLSPAGALSYSTFLGGTTGTDVGKSIAVNAGNILVAGDTSSTNFPVVGAFQSVLGGSTDAFISKINPAVAGASGLLYSTYLGGLQLETLWGISVDSAGAAYVAGMTNSANFPQTNASVLQGIADAFVAKINPNVSGVGSRIYSFFWGGSGSDSASGGIAADAAGNVYVAGNTDSTNFPTVTPFQATLSGGTDAFVTKFNTTGTAVYSTYLGGNGTDIAWFVAVDSSGKAYVTGETTSTNFPTKFSFKPTLGGVRNAFVTNLAITGNSLEYSTYLGGTVSDWGLGIAVDPLKRAYVTGFTQSSDFPLKSPYQTTGAAGGSAFVTKLAFMKSIPGTYLILLLN